MRTKKCLTWFLSLVLVFSLIAPVCAGAHVDDINQFLEKVDLSKFSPEEKVFIKETIINVKDNVLLDEESKFGRSVIIQSPTEHTVIAVQDSQVDIVTKVEDDSYIINGERIEIQVGDVDGMETNGWEEGSNPGGSWVPDGGMIKRNIALENTLKSFTSAVLAAVLGGGLATVPAVAYAIAVNFHGFTSTYPEASVVYVELQYYQHATSPRLYRKAISQDYIKYNGSYKWVGSTTTYLTWIPGAL